jgi:hypothetical protein
LPTRNALCASRARTAQDNLSRGNMGAIAALRHHVPAAATQLRFVQADLGFRDQARRALFLALASLTHAAVLHNFLCLRVRLRLRRRWRACSRRAVRAWIW